MKKKIVLLLIISFFSIVVVEMLGKINIGKNSDIELNTESTFELNTENSAEDTKINILCLGIDKQVVMSERHPVTNSIGQADGIFLVSIDTEKNSVDVVGIPRDTIVTIEKYTSRLNYLGEEEAQICLQYAYADGMELSCELTTKRVEELFPAIQVDGCVAINIQAIIEINDAVGGVEVTVDDAFTALHMGVEQGSTLTLSGENTMLYLRLRDVEQSESAYSRLERIQSYIRAFIPQGMEMIKENPNIISDIYKTLDENMVTNLKVGDMLTLAAKIVDISTESIQFHTLQGEIIVGDDGYEEFYPDPNQLEEVNKILEE